MTDGYEHALRPVDELRTGDERQDVLAYLARKRANALTMAQRSPEFAEEGRSIARQLEILSDDIRAGLHVGEAELQQVQDKPADQQEGGDGL